MQKKTMNFHNFIEKVMFVLGHIGEVYQTVVA